MVEQKQEQHNRSVEGNDGCGVGKVLGRIFHSFYALQTPGILSEMIEERETRKGWQFEVGRYLLMYDRKGLV